MRSTFQNFFQKLIRHGLEYFGLFYASYRGTVVDNRDPEMLGRLKISCPAIYGDDVPSYWAWAKVSFAGNQIGFFAIPQIGDGVYIECECGNPKYPIWSGGWWSKPGAKSEVPETARLLPPTNRVWQTASGHRIELDDTTGAEKIKIIDKSGNYILIDSTTRNEEHLVGGKKIDQVTSDKEETIGGKKTSAVTGDKQETVGGNWSITVTGNATITAPSINLDGQISSYKTGGGGRAVFDNSEFETKGGTVKLASHGAIKKLVLETFLALFDAHIHNGVQNGSGNTGPPTSPAGSGYRTMNTEAS